MLDVPPTPTVVGNRVEDIKTQARRSVQALLDDAYTVSMAEVAGEMAHQLGTVGVQDRTQTDAQDREPAVVPPSARGDPGKRMAAVDSGRSLSVRQPPPAAAFPAGRTSRRSRAE